MGLTLTLKMARKYCMGVTHIPRFDRRWLPERGLLIAQPINDIWPFFREPPDTGHAANPQS